jgi:hypothetical protein
MILLLEFDILLQKQRSLETVDNVIQERRKRIAKTIRGIPFPPEWVFNRRSARLTKVSLSP